MPVYIIDINTIWVPFRKGERERVVVGRLYLKPVLILQAVGLIFAWGRGCGHTFVEYTHLTIYAMHILIVGIAIKSSTVKTIILKN